MNASTLLDNFDIIADAPGGVPKLRELILQLAVRGKLVPQDPKDEPASIFLERLGIATKSQEDRNGESVPKGWVIVTLEKLAVVMRRTGGQVNPV